MNKYQLVLFDLDGTLADTAPDMAATLNRLRTKNSKKTIPREQLRPYVSGGTPALLRIGFGLTPETSEYTSLRKEFLDIYEENICAETELFPGMSELLDMCKDSGVLWGVVTNKPEYLTVQLLRQIGIVDHAACIVGGDTLPERKPSPLPILHACELAKIQPWQAVYIGDAQRDIQAGRDAGLETIAVTYGYIPPEDDPESWGANRIVHTATEIAAHLWE